MNLQEIVIVIPFERATFALSPCAVARAQNDAHDLAAKHFWANPFILLSSVSSIRDGCWQVAFSYIQRPRVSESLHDGALYDLEIATPERESQLAPAQRFIIARNKAIVLASHTLTNAHFRIVSCDVRNEQGVELYKFTFCIGPFTANEQRHIFTNATMYPDTRTCIFCSRRETMERHNDYCPESPYLNTHSPRPLKLLAFDPVCEYAQTDTGT